MALETGHGGWPEAPIKLRALGGLFGSSRAFLFRQLSSSLQCLGPAHVLLKVGAKRSRTHSVCVCVVCCSALCCMVWKIQMWSGSIHLRSPHKKPREHSACHVKCFLLAKAGLALCRGFRFWSDRLRILCLRRLGEPKSPGLWGEAMCWDQDIEVFRESLELVCGACGYSWGESAERERAAAWLAGCSQSSWETVCHLRWMEWILLLCSLHPSMEKHKTRGGFHTKNK